MKKREKKPVGRLPRFDYINHSGLKVFFARFVIEDLGPPLASMAHSSRSDEMKLKEQLIYYDFTSKLCRHKET